MLHKKVSRETQKGKIYVKTLHLCCIVCLIIAYHTISLQCNSHNVRHRSLTKYYRARIRPRNSRNSFSRHAHLYQDVRKRIILKKNKKNVA